MIITEPAFEIIAPEEIEGRGKERIYAAIEAAARTCYRSEDRITRGSAGRMITALVKRKHEAMLEHASMTVAFNVDRGITHELVRHRLASFAQESTRYCVYDNGVKVIDLRGGMEMDPVVGNLTKEAREAIYQEWATACEESEKHYLRMLKLGATPQIARAVLNNSVASRIVVTANMREWRHLLALRAAGTTGSPHPQMKEIMGPLLSYLAGIMPEIFGELDRGVQTQEKENQV